MADQNDRPVREHGIRFVAVACILAHNNDTYGVHATIMRRGEKNIAKTVKSASDSVVQRVGRLTRERGFLYSSARSSLLNRSRRRTVQMRVYTTRPLIVALENPNLFTLGRSLT